MKGYRANSIRFSKGFTLVETLIAIAVLLVAVVGPMTIAAQGLQNTIYILRHVKCQAIVAVLRGHGSIDHDAIDRCLAKGNTKKSDQCDGGGGHGR